MREAKPATLQVTAAFFVFTAALFAMMMVAVGANAQQNASVDLSIDPIDQADSEPTTPIEPVPSGIAESQIFAELVARNESRNASLLEYTALRTYQVIDSKGKVHAQEIGRMEYRAPDLKTFAITSEEGSGLIRHLALGPLISSEIDAAAGKQHEDSSITPANYTFNLLGAQEVGPYHCYVVQAIPKRADKYLFEGKVWIDEQDYAIVRIEGHPAKKLSFWIERADFVRQYQKIGAFWLPQRDATSVQVRLYGRNILIINHQDYVVNPAIEKVDTVQNIHSF